MAVSLLPKQHEAACNHLASVIREISECAKQRDAAGALEALRQVEQPTVAVHNAVLNACGKACEFQLAWDLWQDMPEKDLVSYNIMIGLCGSTQQIRLAEDLWEELSQKGLPPNIITYTAMVTAFGLSGHVDKALSTFSSLKANTSADAHAYAAIMAACARTGDYARTRELFVEMVNSGVSPNRFHFNSLLTACAKSCDSCTAEAIFELMPSYEVKPTAVEYTTLIACCRRDVVRCRELLKEMREANIQPSKFTFQQLAHAEMEAGNHDQAFNLVVEARGRYPQLTPVLTRIAQQLGVS